MKVAFITLGCRINQFYTDCIKQKHIDEGDEIAPLIDKPDIVYINTCGVTTHAGHKSRKIYRKAKRYAKEIRIMGCQGKLFPEEFKNSTFVDESTLIKRYSNPLQIRKRTYLPIQEGCNNFCTYCIVPYARGRNYSLKKETVIRNLKERMDAGHKEVVFTGTNIGSYKNKDTDLASLLKESLQFNIRIRLSSIKPDDINRDLLELFHYKNLMPHLHLSQQSGDNKILKRMGRNYKRDKTIWISEELHKIRENVRIAGDFIVGFPGEGEAEFKNTLHLIREARFSHLHIFRYSKRPYTLASLYPDQVPDSIKKKRFEILMALGKKQRDSFINKQIGSKYHILIENKSSLGGGFLFGITPNYIKVHFQKNHRDEEFVPVVIKDFQNGYVYGEIEQ